MSGGAGRALPVKVLVHGVSGRMGGEVLAALCREPGLEPSCGVDAKVSGEYLSLPDGSGQIPISSDLEAIIARCRPQVMVDFTNAEASIRACRMAASRGVNLVVGTTGLTEANLQELDSLAREHRIGALVAPNFALGAVLLAHLVRGLGKYFEYAEIIEMHHDGKIDSASGTAISLARSLREGRDGPFTRPTPEKEPVQGARGGELEGVSIHSVRMPGRMAHHEVILGTQGQTLSLRHDTINRECYMPGVILAIKEVVKFKGLVVGLDKMLGL
ncbi:MAG: dihydrodipicolinate reductase [Dehalococcoidia bacterium]|nr:dihydrodipicolinate reductase [Dehalococcoidia bacterium]